MDRKEMLNKYFKEDNEYGFHAYTFNLRIDFYEAAQQFQIDQIPVSDNLVSQLLSEWNNA